MTRPSLTRIHLTAAIAAVALITIFLAASAAAELAGSAPAVRLLRHAVLAGLIPLVASLVLTALTGRRLAGGRRSTALRRKQRRLQAAATVGLLILIPCALILNQLAADPASWVFRILVMIEIVFGVVNLSLLALNFRDGRRMIRHRRTAPPSAHLAGSRS